jgi:hypothetical protein
MASEGENRAAIEAATTQADEAAASVRQADDIVSAQLEMLRYALADSSNPLAEEGMWQWAGARERIEEVLAALAAGNAKWEEYLATRGQGGGGGASPATSVGGNGTPPVAGSNSDTEPPRPYDPKARDPDRVAAIRRIGWPRNTKGRTSARGLLYDGKGNPVLHQPLKPLSGERVYDTPDLKDEWRRREVATSWHIEGGVAAYMRGTGTKEMTLWLNIPACGGYRRPAPNGCHENLPKILPPGYKLHVRVEGEDGSYQLNTYSGTGEALKRSE